MNATELALLEQRRSELRNQKSAIEADLAALNAKVDEARADELATKRRDLQAEIAAAEAAGRWDDALRLQAQLHRLNGTMP